MRPTLSTVSPQTVHISVPRKSRTVWGLYYRVRRPNYFQFRTIWICTIWVRTIWICTIWVQTIWIHTIWVRTFWIIPPKIMTALIESAQFEYFPHNNMTTLFEYALFESALLNQNFYIHKVIMLIWGQCKELMYQLRKMKCWFLKLLYY